MEAVLLKRTFSTASLERHRNLVISGLCEIIRVIELKKTMLIRYY